MFLISTTQVQEPDYFQGVWNSITDCKQFIKDTTQENRAFLYERAKDNEELNLSEEEFLETVDTDWNAINETQFEIEEIDFKTDDNNKIEFYNSLFKKSGRADLIIKTK